MVNKYTYNESFFSVVDTEEKAYWLGFITADGGIRKNKRVLLLELSSKDRGHLEKFAYVIGVPVKDRYRLDKRSGKINSMSFVQVNSKVICTQLICLGVKPNKTFDITEEVFTHLEDSLIPHFIRGLFDGDGTVGYYSNGYHAGICSGNHEFLEKVRGLLEKHLEITIAKSTRNRRNCSSFSITGLHKVHKFKDWIYTGSTVALERKSTIFNSFKPPVEYKYVYYIEPRNVWRVYKCGLVNKSFKDKDKAIKFAEALGLDISRNLPQTYNYENLMHYDKMDKSRLIN